MNKKITILVAAGLGLLVSNFAHAGTIDVVSGDGTELCNGLA